MSIEIVAGFLSLTGMEYGQTIYIKGSVISTIIPYIEKNEEIGSQVMDESHLFIVKEEMSEILAAIAESYKQARQQRFG
jgi:hypothetical protein